MTESPNLLTQVLVILCERHPLTFFVISIDYFVPVLVRNV
jgi:hypothetical protein